ncbi:MAG: hypothetical protein J7494_11460 [Sphingobium sp.]|nr:hypothetical protein [Sphingobium sp.]
MSDTTEGYALPVDLVPTPTREYNLVSAHEGAIRQTFRPAITFSATDISDLTTEAPQALPLPLPLPKPLPLPFDFSSRMLVFKQDPTVTEIGVRKVLVRGLTTTGPRNSRIQLQGVAPVAPNSMNDFIQSPGTEGFDAVHTFAVVQQTLVMAQRAAGATIKWQWNSTTNTDPINVSPRAGITMNAFYSRNEKALKFFQFAKPGAPAPAPMIFTCRSLDIVAHETGHAILDSLKPGWIGASSNPQTGALHEAFGDLTAIFLALSQLDQAEALIVLTKGNLHNKNFLSSMAEEFGPALGRDNGLRNADNDKKMSEVSSEVHDLSQVFTGGIYDVLADMFAHDRNLSKEDEALTLVQTGRYLYSLLLRGIQGAPAANATFANVVNQMLTITAADGKPVEYRNFLRNHFTVRQVVVSPTPLTQDFKGKAELMAVNHPHLTVQASGLQDRSRCCGTMRLREYQTDESMFEEELKMLRKGIGGTSK